jgi:hypothetical protein
VTYLGGSGGAGTLRTTCGGGRNGWFVRSSRPLGLSGTWASAGTVPEGKPEARVVVGPVGLSREVPAGGPDLESLGAENVGQQGRHTGYRWNRRRRYFSSLSLYGLGFTVELSRNIWDGFTYFLCR